jgi:YfiH family protein
MIKPPGIPGVAFGTRIDGDARSDTPSRVRLSEALGISPDWATIKQVHGPTVVRARAPGFHGEADAIVTDVAQLPIAIATADCVPVVLIGAHSRAVVHAGWRGVANGVVLAGVAMVAEFDDKVVSAVVGPHIGPCCYAVGTEVVDAIGGFASVTRSGSVSVDLAEAIRYQLGGVPVVDVGICTHDAPDMASYREDATTDRQVAVAWLPQG